MMVSGRASGSWFLGLGSTLNIFSMRSVIMNPPTMLLVAATIAIVPRIGGQRGLVFAGQDDRADHGDGVQRVGQRHQRRVQQRRNAANHFKSDETPPA